MNDEYDGDNSDQYKDTAIGYRRCGKISGDHSKCSAGKQYLQALDGIVVTKRPQADNILHHQDRQNDRNGLNGRYHQRHQRQGQNARPSKTALAQSHQQNGRDGDDIKPEVSDHEACRKRGRQKTSRRKFAIRITAFAPYGRRIQSPDNVTGACRTYRYVNAAPGARTPTCGNFAAPLPKTNGISQRFG